MGCFNMVGFYSNLPIKACDDIVYFICGSYGKIDSTRSIGTNDIIEPICLPIFGKYNDYGSIEDIVKDDNVKSIEKTFKIPIEEFISTIEENSFARKNEGDENYNSILKKMMKTQFFKKKSTFSLCVTMEHKSVYDMMVSLFKNDYVWGEEKTWDEKYNDILDRFIEYFDKNERPYTNVFNPHKTKYDVLKIIEIQAKILNNKSSEEEIINSLSNNDKKQWKLYKNRDKFEWESFDLISKTEHYLPFSDYYFNLIMYNIVKIDYKKLKNDILNFMHFERSLKHLCGKYITSDYGLQSLTSFKKELTIMNECYKQIIDNIDKYE